MNYYEILIDIVKDDYELEDLLDKCLEKFLDSNNLNDPDKYLVKAYQSTDELDDVNAMKNKGYNLKKLDRVNEDLAVAIYEKPVIKEVLNWADNNEKSA